MLGLTVWRSDASRSDGAVFGGTDRRWYSTDDCAFSPIFNNFVNCYGLPRFDVERYYPNYPDAPRSGFLFTLDVGALLALGVRPGNHILKVRVGDQQQTFTELPNRDGIPVFFECAENRVASAVGFIDVPQPNDFMKGTVTFQGWAVIEHSSLVAVEGQEPFWLSERFACVDCGISLPPIEPRMFSFNGPHGACPACDGLGACKAPAVPTKTCGPAKCKGAAVEASGAVLTLPTLLTSLAGPMKR